MAKPKTKKPHTTKPVQLAEAERMYKHWSKGFSYAKIAAEKLNRKCYGMEIEPIYVDVSVRRWQNYTGKKAILIRKGKQSKIIMPDEQKVAAYRGGVG